LAEDQPLALRRRKTTGKRGVQRRDALLCGSGIGAIGGFVLRVERRQPFGDGAEPKCGIGRIEPGMGVGVAVIMGIAVIMTFGLGRAAVAMADEERSRQFEQRHVLPLVPAVECVAEP